MALLAVAGFASFGVSDLWELRTGTWAAPLGLLVLNVCCVVGLLGCGFYYRSRRAGD